MGLGAASVPGLGSASRVAGERWFSSRCLRALRALRSRSSVVRGASASTQVSREATGGVEAERRVPAHLGADERGQQPADLVAAERAHTEAFLDERRERVVGAHQAGAAHPADARRDQLRVLAPCLVAGAAEHDLERGLGLAVGPVAAEAAVVGREREQHGAGCECSDQPLHAEQLQAQSGLEGRAGLARIAGGRERREGRQERGRQRVHPQVVPPLAPTPRDMQPLHERVDVAERGEVRGHDVELGIRTGGRAVQVAVETSPRGRVGRRGEDDGRAAPQQVPRQRGPDRARRSPGDERDLATQVGGGPSETPSSATSAGVTFGGAVTGASGAPEARPRMRSRGRESSAVVATIGAPWDGVIYTARYQLQEGDPPAALSFVSVRRPLPLQDCAALMGRGPVIDGIECDGAASWSQSAKAGISRRPLSDAALDQQSRREAGRCPGRVRSASR